MPTIDELLNPAGGRPGQPAPMAQPAPTGGPTIRRETGIGWPTLATLGALAAAVAAARHPRVSAKLSELWQKPLQPLERWTGGRPVEIGGWKPGLPSELPLLRKNPDSMLISDTERMGANLSKETHGLLEQPWAKDLLKQSPEAMKDTEHFAVADYLSKAASGMPQHAAKAAALSASPQWFQEANAYRASMLPQEQWAKRFMGLERIPEKAGPYLHRKTVRDETASLRGHGGLFGELRTSLAGAEKQRQYPTMLAGEAAGVKYDDPRVAWLIREVGGMRLIETAKYLQRLENRVVFRDKAAAQAIAGTGKVFELEAFPGAPTWYVPHYEEWKFLVDNLKDAEYGKLGFLKHWSDTIARNPNLINPLPHIVKNMAYKYRMAGGQLSKLPGDWQEFTRGTSPMVRLFKTSMPFDETGHTAADMLKRAIHGIRSEQYPAVVRLADMALDQSIGRLHRFSSKTIFATADPAMRFSLWKQYVAKGLSPQEAAQNVWIDLIRYGTRSTLVDAWKAIPFNFFVPWRLGTVTTLYKQVTDHPFRTAMFIGAVDLLREIRYRQTGRWTHLPIDYVETPIAQVLQARDDKDAAKSLVGATLATVAFGPGGGFAAATISDVMKDIQASGDWRHLQRMFWGVSQLVDGGKSATDIFRHLKTGNQEAAVRDATNLFMTLATAEHAALNYRPRRLLAALPEVGPWLTKSTQVRMAERMQEGMERRMDMKEQRRELLKDQTIEKRVKRATEPAPLR